MRNRIAVILLFLSWPVCVIHRLWNNATDRNVRWIVYDKSVSQDFRWYYVYNELWLSSVLIVLAFLICKSKNNAVRTMLNATLLIHLFDIVNYWLWFRRNEVMLTLEGVTMFSATILIIKYDSTRHHEKTA